MVGALLIFIVVTINTVSSTVINGGWSVWGPWSIECSEICDLGQQSRWRYCDNPTPSPTGSTCAGSNVDYKPCHLKPCTGTVLATDGQSCENYCTSLGASVKCGTDIHTANRVEAFTFQGVSCSIFSIPTWNNKFDPSYQVATSACNGYLLSPEEISCDVAPPLGFKRLCNCYTPDDVGFSQWTSWGACSTTCGSGTQYQSRYCQYPPCSGDNRRRRYCSEQKCPVHGALSDWSSWSSCSVTCGGGMKTRSRTCTNPIPMYGGDQCFNIAEETGSCSVQCCPINGSFSQWTSWNSCPVCSDPLNGRHHLRYRTCLDPPPMYDGLSCSGEYVDKMPCDDLPINETCPETLLKLEGVLTEQLWENQLLYPPNTIYDDLVAFISNSIFLFYEESLAPINSSVSSVSVESFQLINNKFTSLIDIVYNSINKEEYIYLLDELRKHGSMQKLAIEINSYKVSINDSLLTNISLLGEVPKEQPDIISTTSLSSNSFEISWKSINDSNFNVFKNNTHNFTLGGYYIYLRYADVRESRYQGRTVWMNVTSTLVTGLNPGTLYKVIVLGYNAWGNGVPSKVVYVKTLPQLPVLPPDAPEITINEINPGHLFIQWEKIPLLYMNGQPVSYNMYIIRDSNGHTEFSAKIPYTSDRVQVAKLAPANHFVIKVCPENEVGEGLHCTKTTWSTKGNTQTWHFFNVQVQPRTAPNSIKISWNPVPFNWYYGDLVGYNIIYTVTKYGFNDLDNPVTKNVSAPAHQNSLTINDLVFSGHYTINVQAINQDGYGIESAFVTTENCICPLKVTTNYFMEKPYVFRNDDGTLTGLFVDVMDGLIEQVCKTCSVNGVERKSTVDWVTNGKGNWAEKHTSQEASSDIIGSPSLSFPFFLDDSTASYLTGTFVPVISYPGSFLFTMAPAFDNFVDLQIKEIASILPFILIMLLFIVICGILLWICERSKNSDQFHPDFLRGALLQGFYWSFVTMTTVGYGDKHATTIPGRIFAMFWILASMIIISTFLGSVTTVVMKTENSKFDFKMLGSKISVLKGSLEQKLAETGQAKVRALRKPENVSSVLLSRSVDGALVNVYDAALNMELFSIPQMVVLRTVETSKSYGIVLSSELSTSADFFNSAIKANATVIALAFQKYMPALQFNFPENAESTSLTSANSPQMKIAMVTLIIMLIFFTGVGASVWYLGFKRWKHKHTTEATRRRIKVNRDARRELTKMLEKWKDKITKDMANMERKHTNEKLHMWKNLKPGVQDTIRPENYAITPKYMNRPFVTS